MCDRQFESTLPKFVADRCGDPGFLGKFSERGSPLVLAWLKSPARWNPIRLSVLLISNKKNGSQGIEDDQSRYLSDSKHQNV